MGQQINIALQPAVYAKYTTGGAFEIMASYDTRSRCTIESEDEYTYFVAVKEKGVCTGVGSVVCSVPRV